MHDAMNRGVRPRYRREVKCAGCQYDEYCWTR
jgi:CRISPR/Cas system-associated exonuclease Cas4 (RecB family)